MAQANCFPTRNVMTWFVKLNIVRSNFEAKAGLQMIGKLNKKLLYMWGIHPLYRIFHRDLIIKIAANRVALFKVLGIHGVISRLGTPIAPEFLAMF
jgi:hypothetical protein